MKGIKQLTYADLSSQQGNFNSLILVTQTVRPSIWCFPQEVLEGNAVQETNDFYTHQKLNKNRYLPPDDGI